MNGNNNDNTTSAKNLYYIKNQIPLYKIHNIIVNKYEQDFSLGSVRWGCGWRKVQKWETLGFLVGETTNFLVHGAAKFGFQRKSFYFFQ